MFGSTGNTGLTTTKIISGISKTLNIANQAIPIYKEIKPMVGNARKVISVIKELNSETQKNPVELFINNKYIGLYLLEYNI